MLCKRTEVMTAFPQIAMLCTPTPLYYYSTVFHLDQILKVRTRLGGECLRVNTSIKDTVVILKYWPLKYYLVNNIARGATLFWNWEDTLGVLSVGTRQTIH